MPVKIEREITLDGKKITLVSSFKGLMFIEKVAEAGLVTIMARMGKKDIRMGDIAAIIAGGIMGNRDIAPKDRLNYDEVGEILHTKGMMEVVADCVLFLSDVVMAGHEEQTAGEAKGREPKNLEHA